MDNDTVPSGGETLSLDEAAKAYAAVTQTKEPQGQPDPEDTGEDTAGDTDELEADAEGDAEDDGEPETEGQPEDDEDDEEPESEKGRYVAHNGRVKLPDGSESTIADLIAGNMKDRDYRQKTMAHAEDVKSFKAQSEALKASQQQIDQQREYVASLVKSIIGTPPDPSLVDPASPNYDPAKYQTDEVRYRSWAQHLTYLESEQQRLQQERQAQTETQTQDRVNKEWAAALDKLPELKDPKKLDSFGKDTLKFGAEYGYTPQELATIHHDHRQLLVMKDAMAWRKLQSSKDKVQKKIENRPPVQKGGKRLNPNETRARAVSDATSRLQQTGRLDDAVAAYLATQK